MKCAAEMKYADRISRAKANIAKLKELLARHEQEAADDPKNWGFAGDLGKVNEDLENLIDFLGGGK